MSDQSHMSHMPHRMKSLLGFFVALDIVILDQLSKWVTMELVLRPHVEGAGAGVNLVQWLVAAPERLPPVSLELLPFFNLVMVWNEGVSFGMLQGAMPLFLVGFSLIVTVVLALWLARVESWPQTLALAMVIGGALGNVIDRLRFGAVADFWDFHAFGYHWPAFNLADSAITLGIAFLVADSVFLAPRRIKE